MCILTEIHLQSRLPFGKGGLLGLGARGSGWNVIFLGLKVNQGHRRSNLFKLARIPALVDLQVPLSLSAWRHGQVASSRFPLPFQPLLVLLTELPFFYRSQQPDMNNVGVAFHGYNGPGSGPPPLPKEREGVLSQVQPRGEARKRQTKHTQT